MCVCVVRVVVVADGRAGGRAAVGKAAQSRKLVLQSQVDHGYYTKLYREKGRGYFFFTTIIIIILGFEKKKWMKRDLPPSLLL